MIMDEATKADIRETVLSCDGVKSAKWEQTQSATLHVEIDVHLPQDCGEIGCSPAGVRALEPVCLEFGEEYPFNAPKIILRDDFPRSFPHINPSLEKVIPCIYEGNLSELMQQSGLGRIVDQLNSWLRKAAADELMDLDQGWEWMRNDDCSGVLKGNFDDLRTAISTVSCDYKGCFAAKKIQSCFKDYFTAVLLPEKFDAEKLKENVFPCFIYAARPEKIISVYYPNRITDLDGLKKFFATHVSETGLEDFLQQMAQAKAIKQFIVIAVIRRPVSLIKLHSNLEILPFRVTVKRTKKGKIASRSPVTLLGTADLCSPSLMRQVSGHESSTFRGQYVQLGCGSLGSKISLHLLRNGLKRTCFIDHDMLLSHNMARHALVWGEMDTYKHLMMAITANCFNSQSQYSHDYIKTVTTLSPSDLIVDSTASLAVRNRLVLDDVKGRIVHTALYGKSDSQCGICFIEGSERNPRVDDICFRFMRANVLENCGAVDYTRSYLEYATFGQGCSSLTMKVDDSTISLLASGMARRIQRYMDLQFPEMGDCRFGKTEDGETVHWRGIDMGKTIVMSGIRQDAYRVRVLSVAKDDMDKLARSAHPNEIGGYLIGAITANTKTITVVACLPPPEDSKGDSMSFILGNAEMKRQAAEIDRRSNGVLGILGTWHTHPIGGSASSVDYNTYNKLFRNRRFPTLCIIWTPEGLECLPEMEGEHDETKEISNG